MDDSTVMQVEKVETLNIPAEEITEVDSGSVTLDSHDNDENKENLKDIYNKMTVQDLKKMVITKGLCSDASKLKKNELLKLLENTE